MTKQNENIYPGNSGTRTPRSKTNDKHNCGIPHREENWEAAKRAIKQNHNAWLTLTLLRRRPAFGSIRSVYARYHP